MNDFLVGVYIGLGMIGAVAVAFAVIGLVYLLASYNLFWTIVQEGTAKAIMKWGQFHCFVMSYQGHAMDESWNIWTERNGMAEVPNPDGSRNPDGSPNMVPVKPMKGTRHRRWFGGLRWVGIPLIKSVRKYKFRWASFEQVQEGGKMVDKIVPAEKEIDYILVRDDIYYTFIREAEIKGVVPVDVDALLTIRIVNPYKALFRIQNWLETVQNILKPALRVFLSGKTYEEAIAKKEVVEREDEELLRSTGVGAYIERDYGARLKKVGFVNVGPGGTRGETYLAASTKQWEAEKDAERIRTLADADVARMDKVYGKLREYGDTGLFVRLTEAMQEIGKGPSNLVIFPFGAIKDVMEAWIGKREGTKP